MFSIDNSYSITVAQGDSFSFPLRVWADQAKTTLRSFAGKTIKLVACKAPTSANGPVGAAVMTLSTAGTGAVYNDTTKVVTFSATPTMTQLPLGTYPYGIEVSGDGEVETLVIGELVVIEDVA